MAGWMTQKPGINITRRNINNLIYAGNITLMTESKMEIKILWMRVKDESEKSGLELNIQKPKIMASGKWMEKNWQQ